MVLLFTTTRLIYIHRLSILLVFLLFLKIIFKCTSSWFQSSRSFKDPSLLDAGEGSVAAVVLGQEFIDELINVRQHELSIVQFLPNLAVVIVERLEILVYVGDGAGEAQVERPKNPNILVVLVLDELDDDVLVRLDLEHLEGEA